MKKKRIVNKNIIINDLVSIGLKEGDIVLVRADLSKVGRLEEKNKNVYLESILEVIGVSGTLVGLAFTKDYMFRINQDYIFDGTNNSYIGAFANLMLTHDKSKRSTHPTNSYVAIGRYADAITSNHTEKSGAYEPIRKLIELNGKMLLIGCVNSSPGFTTTHLVEIDLGLYKRIIFPTINRVLFKKDNKIKLFKRKDLGACSASYMNMYAHYIKNESLYTGFIGNAFSILISAKDAYDIDLSIAKNNPKFNICDNDKCFMCNTRRWDRLHKAPLYWIKLILHYIKYKEVMK